MHQSSEASLSSEAGLFTDRSAGVVLAAVVAIVAVLTVTPWPVGIFQDDAIYTVLAKALAEGKGFRLINLPGEPHGTHFPPGYPLVLAAIWKLWPSFPDNLVAFKFVNAGFLGLAAAGFYHFCRRVLQLTQSLAACYAILGTLSIVVILVTGVVMSEPLFMAAMIPVLAMSERAARSGSWRDAVIAGLCVGLWAMIRTLGMFALPALLLVLLWKRHWKAAAAALAGALIVLLPWQLWTGAYAGEVPSVLVGKYGAYGPWVADGYRAGGVAFGKAVVWRNLQDMYGMMSYLMIPVQSNPPRAVATVAVVGMMVLGVPRALRLAPVTYLFLGAYLAIVLLWPFEPNRFLLAVWPLFFPLLGFGIASSWNAVRAAWPRTALRAVVGATVLYLVGGFGWYNVMGYSRQWWASFQRDVGQRAKPTVEWAAKYTPPNAVIATDDDLIVFLYAGRQAVPVGSFTPVERLRATSDDENEAAIRAIFSTYNPSFLVVASAQGIRNGRRLAEQSKPLVRPVGRTTHAMIFERVTP